MQSLRTGENVVSDFVLAPIQDKEFRDAAGFLASIFGSGIERYLGEFAHWWAANPRWLAKMPRGWLARAKLDNEPIGFTANIPLPYTINGKTALCFATGSTAVHSQWRRRGVARALGQAFVGQDAAFLVGNDASVPAMRLWLSVGMQVLERPGLSTRYDVLCNLATLSGKWAVRKRLPRQVGAVVGHVATGLLSTIELRRSRGLQIEEVRQFEAKDTEALARCCASNCNTYAWRDPEILNWILTGESYLRRTRVAFVARSSGRLVGYLLMKMRRDHPSFYLLECRCRDADVDIARELFVAARSFARRNHYENIAVRPYTAMIKSALPLFSLRGTKLVSKITMAEPTGAYCYRFNGVDVDIERWEAGPGDGDIAVN